MKIFSSYLIAITVVQYSMSWMISELPSTNPLLLVPLKNEILYDANSAGFGIWSRYVPLSNVVQLEEIGILDSSCFHMFRIQGQINNELHFLQYDCVNYQQKTIKKYFQFLSKDGSNYNEIILINEASYEFIWYFQGYITIPSQKQVIIYWYEQMNQIFSKQIQIEFPYEYLNSNLIIGGQFKVTPDSPLYSLENSILSYFPGEIVYVLDVYLDEPDYFIDIIQKNNKFGCKCIQSAITNLGDALIQGQDQFQFLSQKTNCQSFLLSSWIKIKEINMYQEQFYYQLFKLSGNFDNPKLTQDNLCAFQLLYNISPLGNQIIITSYSFTTPIVNIDFSNNPFLKTETFDINCNIQLWHYILVEKTNTAISISITFYQGLDQIQFNMNLQVNQFSMVQFKLLYGNIFKSQSNYLNIQIIGLKLYNCPDFDQPQLNCHPTCKQCDGPTKEDCLSCFELSNRIYLPDYKECVCEYGTIDQDYQCINYQSLQFNLIQEKPLKEECQYGYFESNDECIKCPSIINNNVITCLECVQNPKQWGQTLFCETILLTDKNGNISNYQTHTKQQYILAGDSVDQFFDYDSINSQYNQVESIFQFKILCQSIQSDCYQCPELCLKCELQTTTLICFIELSIPPNPNKICEPPNFVDFYNQCVTCKIENCLYCFNYLSSDPSKTTLGFYQKQTLIDEEIKVGCAQCFEGFIFDFITGECIYSNPSQQNCLRSYINLDSKEICTLSAINDFSFALEIINCQIHILNCLQCIQTIQQTLKCLICEDGYQVSSFTGICIKCNFEFAKQCFENNMLEPWKWLVQGFIIQYLPNRPISIGLLYLKKILETSCIQGYKTIQYECYKYCDETCSVCEPDYEKFFCSKCKLNYYKEPSRVQVDGKCINCPSLCQVCQERPEEEINTINPYFTITPQNAIYTYQCIQKIPSQYVNIEQNYKIAQFCYLNSCNYNLELNYLIQDSYDCTIMDSIEISQYFNYQYFNEIGLQKLTLLFQMPEDNCNIYNPKLIMKNSFKENIFSLQQVRFTMKGAQTPINLFTDNFNLSFLNYDQILLSHIEFSIQSELILIFKNRGLPVDLMILNTQLYSISNSPITISIQGESFLNLNLQNVTIFNISIENQVVFNLVITEQKDTIIINNFQLQNCVFKNSTLFLFQNFKRTIYIENFTIDSCQFYNSTIINFNQNQNQLSNIILNEVFIQNSLFNNSNLIYSIEKTALTISKIQIMQNQIINSKFILFNYDFYCNDVFIQGNQLILTQLIQQISSLLSNSAIQMNNIKIQENFLFNFSLFVTEQKSSTSKVRYLLQNLYFEDNDISCDQEQFLITVNSYSFYMKNIFLRNTKNYRFFSLQAIPFISIENIIYENLHQEQKVQKSPGCIKHCSSHSQLLFVFGFTNITLNTITIINQYTIDYSIISIQSNPLIVLNSNQYIAIKDVIVKGNILLKQNLGIMFSLIELYSEKPQQIKIDNLTYEENIFHQYNQDPSKTSASLLYVNSPLGLMILNDILCFSNALTNSSSSYFSLFLLEIQINNFQVYNHNYNYKEFWIQYYEINFEDEFNQSEISYVISQSYQIENIGGALLTTVTKLTILNGVFNYIITQSSQVFHIISQGDGIVIIKNCSIAHVYNLLISNVQNDGAFTINGKNSLLSIYLQNITLINVQNKLSPSIFSIYPSSTKNNIHFKYIFVQDCFSLVHQIINFEADYYNAQSNKVKIDNLRIIQNEIALMNFLQSLAQISLIEMQKVINDNAIMNFQGCELLLNEIQIEGLILYSIITIQDSKSIKLINCNFIDILTFYPLHIINIQQNNIQQPRIYFNNIQISNLNNFAYLKYNLYYFSYHNIEFEFIQCNFKNNYVVQNIQKGDLLKTFFDDLITYSNQQGSLIKLKTVTNQTQIAFSNVLLLNNNCQNCWDGLIVFELTDFSQIQISELSCIKNQIKNYGCIYAKSDKRIDSLLLIDHSTFIANVGTLGTGISVQNLRVKITNSKIMNNTASSRGGGFYFEEGTQRFNIKSTIIIYNQAEEAGGIYLSGNSSLNTNNFIKSLLLLNFAKLPSNNINEIPTHLQLSINQVDMYSQNRNSENLSYQVLLLKPFKIISQDHLIQTNFLFIPSGQQILNFELYNPQYLEYQPYISEFTIKLKNSMNEQQINFLNSTCKVQQQIFDFISNNVIELITISTISFNESINSFNLGLLQFNMDPYQQENKIYEILIYCNTEYQSESMAYRIRVKSFLCQLGEFYITQGCQKCQSEQGFYSVTYNTTKCSLFDKNKFEAITSNKINLKSGFWRKAQISENIELCYKNQIHCLGGWVVGDDLCFKGHLGGLCEECDRYNIRGDGQFFKNQQQLDCQHCDQLSKRLIAFFLVLIWAVLSTLLTIQSIEKTNQLYAQIKLSQNKKFSQILFKLQQDHESILLKLFLNYLWIFSLIFTFNISFSFSLNFVKPSNDTSYFMANFFECLLAEIQGIELIYSRILAMLVIMVCQILIIFLGCQLLSILKFSKFQSRIISIAILYLYIQNYASLINQFFSILAVRRISDLDFIQGDVSLIYGSESHIYWIFGFAIPGAFIIGFVLPLLLFLLLYINKDQHNQINFRRHIGYLFNEYTQMNYFWEIIKLWKKTIIIVILIYFETDVYLKASLLSLCITIYSLIAQHFKPYILHKFNLLDIKSGQYCQIAIFLATVKHICEQQEKEQFSFLIQSIIVLDSIILCYPFIIDILKVYYKKYRIQIFQLLLKGFQYLKPKLSLTKSLKKKLTLLKQREDKSKSNIKKLKQILYSRISKNLQAKSSLQIVNSNRGIKNIQCISETSI